MVVDGGITLLSMVGFYESSGTCAAGFFDIVTVTVCSVGAIGVSWPERERDYTLRDAQSIAGTLVGTVRWVSSPMLSSLDLNGGMSARMVVWTKLKPIRTPNAVDLVCSIGDCVVCCTVWRRRRRTRRNATANPADDPAGLPDLHLQASQDGPVHKQQGAGLKESHIKDANSPLQLGPVNLSGETANTKDGIPV
ncbi:hypothetical protein N657DRAFT_649991 [Parathielavia appendiculata]|uniref:Uncharacterized protein n=1 Tax=Parathielavia appendiculata TaxID=2587402 RepID=A0AAN6TS58_9PEZI|nr:hypothetical protein N657DRAFT_649991 [Parathielavia appendiculata]